MASKCAQCRRHHEQFAEFTQIVSHDLQSPVNKIISFLDLLQKHLGSEFDPKAAEYLERVEKNAATLTVLMKKLREYANAASVADEIETVDLSETLKAAQQQLQPDLERAQARVSAGPLPTVQGRRAQLKTIWQNLLSNAIVHR